MLRSSLRLLHEFPCASRVHAVSARHNRHHWRQRYGINRLSSPDFGHSRLLLRRLPRVPAWPILGPARLRGMHPVSQSVANRTKHAQIPSRRLIVSSACVAAFRSLFLFCCRCEPGSFNKVLGAIACTLAPRGFYANGTGTIDDTPCQPGRYTPEKGATACLACAFPIPPLRCLACARPCRRRCCLLRTSGWPLNRIALRIGSCF